jgi:hypothetical protein
MRSPLFLMFLSQIRFLILFTIHNILDVQYDSFMSYIKLMCTYKYMIFVTVNIINLDLPLYRLHDLKKEDLKS